MVVVTLFDIVAALDAMEIIANCLTKSRHERNLDPIKLHPKQKNTRVGKERKECKEWQKS